MPRSDDPFDRLRALIDEVAADDAADLLAEARIEARARVRKTLTDALTRSMLERLHEEMLEVEVEPHPSAEPPPAPPPPPTERLASSGRSPTPGEPAWYVYGVVEAETQLEDTPGGVDPLGPVTTLTEAGLAAVCSQVPLDEFDEERLRDHLADMAWVEATARAHEAVLEGIRAQTTVIPMRMCTVYRTEGGIREMLSREAAPLQEALDHLDGKAEWGVKVFTDIARSGGGLDESDAGAGTSPGAAYMERKRTERERRERALELAEEVAALIHERLSEVASDSQVIPLQRPEVSGHRGDMILNGVYLVADGAVETFHEEVRVLASELEPQGFELQPTGPWPAYNFVPGTIGAAW